MSLKPETVIWVENQKKIADLRKEIITLNSVAQTALNEKRAEQTAIQNQLTSDVQAKQDQINALEV